MRPDRLATTLSFDEALRRVLAAVRPISRTEVVTLRDSAGRVAAADLVPVLDVPLFDRATMDGYAVDAADLVEASETRPISLICAGQILTGEPSAQSVQPGRCLEIATGAPMPPGSDAVVQVERTAQRGDEVVFYDRAVVGQNVGRRGSDLARGRTAIRSGMHLTPARTGVIGAMGLTELVVYARPSVAILATGSELVGAGRPGPAQVHDVNSTTLAAVTAEHGAVPHTAAPVRDEVGELTAALERAASHDVIVCSGGSSVGRKDLLTEALGACGRIDFHGIEVKPGKPTLFGDVGGTPIFGMPGNPTSCLANAYLLLAPYLRATARLPPWRPTRVRLPLATRIVSRAGRHQFYTVRVLNDRVEPAFKSSGDITSMADADGYIEIAADVSTLEAGEPVTVTLF